MIYSLVKPRGRKEIIMKKLDFYFKVSRIEKMMDAILNKFNMDLIISGVSNGKVMSHHHKLMINTGHKVFCHAGHIIESDRASDVLWDLIEFNNEYDMGWDEFLTALELAIEEIQHLKRAELE